MNFHNTDLDFTNVPTRELRCRMAQMGIQYPVWKAMEAELAARQKREDDARDRFFANA